MPGARLGTPACMAPEQFHGLAADPAHTLLCVLGLHVPPTNELGIPPWDLWSLEASGSDVPDAPPCSLRRAVIFVDENVDTDDRPRRRDRQGERWPRPVGYELFSNPTDRRYLLARLRRPEGDVYVSVFTSQCKGKPSWGQPPVLIVEVVEEKPMETGKVVVDAEALKGGLEREGKVALSGLFFDGGQAVVKPESRPQLEQIAAMLDAQPALELLVVGHTDAEGTYEANVTLSQRRADAVVEALVSGFSITPGRLKAVGVGMAAPVASNDVDAGRARNRRVELVARPKRQR